MIERIIFIKDSVLFLLVSCFFADRNHLIFCSYEYFVVFVILKKFFNVYNLILWVVFVLKGLDLNMQRYRLFETRICDPRSNVRACTRVCVVCVGVNVYVSSIYIHWYYSLHIDICYATKQPDSVYLDLICTDTKRYIYICI